MVIYIPIRIVPGTLHGWTVEARKTLYRQEIRSRYPHTLLVLTDGRISDPGDLVGAIGATTAEEIDEVRRFIDHLLE